MSTPTFSIVVPTLNEEKYFPLLLDDLCAQTFTNFEVIHVDAGSEDKTVSNAQKYSDKLDLTILHSDKKNISYQRNTGGAKARGEWIIFMDADNRLSGMFLEKILEQINNRTFDSFTCWMGSQNGSMLDKLMYSTINIDQAVQNMLRRYAAFGAMIGVKKKVFELVRFDEDRKILEDTFYVRAVAEHGFIFKALSQPRYEYSLRRFKKDGVFKTIKTATLLQLGTLKKGHFRAAENFYSMGDGGKYYDDQDSPKQSIKTGNKKDA